MDAQYAGEFGPDALAIRHALQFPPGVVRRETASGRTVPAATCGMAVVKSANIIDTRPPMMSSSAGGVLL